jgi:hypothetical protein
VQAHQIQHRLGRTDHDERERDAVLAAGILGPVQYRQVERAGRLRCSKKATRRISRWRRLPTSYPSSRAVAQMRVRVSSARPSWFFSARETVPIE